MGCAPSAAQLQKLLLFNEEAVISDFVDLIIVLGDGPEPKIASFSTLRMILADMFPAQATPNLKQLLQYPMVPFA